MIWLKDHGATIALSFMILLVVLWAIRSLRRRRGCGHCAGCSLAESCQKSVTLEPRLKKEPLTIKKKPDFS